MFGSPERIFHHVIRILVSESSFFILRISTVVSSNVSVRMPKYSNVLKSLNLFEFDCWWLTQLKWPQKGSIMK